MPGSKGVIRLILLKFTLDNFLTVGVNNMAS